ncbi:hypothetical protein CesoFtcFv8_010762 [Champsocephalus esox]|uniref:Uncharacterized protein n=2 Tax=Champsocephalus TaxID=52236 RepID=A0AAN8DJK0_CHAGU|nr:hypothetical protein CesoFtcFv8_010762 [Champsocephalus esox]KAK5923065.1 hypothetical protein CgunFtcFv8_000070 [Champsocephalus gunnari]
MEVVPARVPLSPGSDVTLPECMASSAAPRSPGPDSRNISKTCSKMSTLRRNGGWKDSRTETHSVSDDAKLPL